MIGGTSRAIVVGAGIAGLTAAYRLQQNGYAVRVLEAADRVGGRMSTVRREGYTIDRGAIVLTSRYTEMLALVAELGLSHEVRRFNDAMGFFRDGTVYRMRARAPTDLVFRRLISMRSKLSAAKLLIDAKRLGRKMDMSDLSSLDGLDGESVREYCDRRLNPELRDYLVDPTLRGLYPGTIDDFASTELFLLVEKFLGGALLNTASGIDFLPEALAARLDVQLGARATCVEERGAEVTVAWERAGEPEQVEHADVCVIALTARQVPALYPQMDAERTAILLGLDYSQLWSIQLGVDPRPTEKAVIVQIPTAEHAQMTTAIFDHNKAPGRAPEGKGLIGSGWLTSWYEEHAEDDDERVAMLVARAMRMIVPGIEDHVEFFHITRWNPGLLLAKPGTWSALARFHALTSRAGRVQFAGDYLGGGSTNASLASGERAARILTAARL